MCGETRNVQAPLRPVVLRADTAPPPLVERLYGLCVCEACGRCSIRVQRIKLEGQVLQSQVLEGSVMGMTQSTGGALHAVLWHVCSEP